MIYKKDKDQLEFDWEGRDPVEALPGENEQALFERLYSQLVKKTGLLITLTITDNVSRMASYKRSPCKTAVSVRLHHMFLHAPDRIINVIVHWILHPRSKKYAAAFDQFIAEQHDRVRKKSPPITLHTRGKVYDLKELYKEVNAQFFNNEATAAITWGQQSKGRQRSISGKYIRKRHLIRIHPRLDQDFVPRYVIRHIVYHEMLHSVLPRETTAGGRRRIHSPTFKDRERQCPDYERTEAWLNDKNNLGRLLCPGFIPRKK